MKKTALPYHRLAPSCLVFLFVILLPAQPPEVTEENFDSPPSTAGWHTFGALDLFHWNSGEEWLEITWDTDQPNSYFYRQLPTELSRKDDFSFELELRFDSISVDHSGFYGFQIALGLVNLQQALDPGFDRSTGLDSPNLLEFNYFPDTGFGATISPVIISIGHDFAVSFNFPLELDPGPWFHLRMSYQAGEEILRTEMTRDGQPFGPIQEVRLPETFGDFRLNAFAFSSYHDHTEEGRIVARAAADNIRIVTPPPPVRDLTGAWNEDRWETAFHSLEGWRYSLESAFDLASWFQTGATAEGTGARLTLIDPEPSSPTAFYRIRADRLE